MENGDRLTATRVRILIVEDDQDLLESETRMLARAGFDVYSASDGETALRILESTDLDIILTDLRLPGISGIQVLQASRDKNPAIRVYLLTAYVDDRRRQEALLLGASGFLTKPVTKADLLAALGPATVL